MAVSSLTGYKGITDHQWAMHLGCRNGPEQPAEAAHLSPGELRPVASACLLLILEDEAREGRPFADEVTRLNAGRTDVMASRKKRVAIGVFEDARRAHQAVQDLVKAGFKEEQIGVVSHNPEARK